MAILAHNCSWPPCILVKGLWNVRLMWRYVAIGWLYLLTVLYLQAQTARRSWTWTPSKKWLLHLTKAYRSPISWQQNYIDEKLPYLLRKHCLCVFCPLPTIAQQSHQSEPKDISSFLLYLFKNHGQFWLYFGVDSTSNSLESVRTEAFFPDMAISSWYVLALCGFLQFFASWCHHAQWKMIWAQFWGKKLPDDDEHQIFIWIVACAVSTTLIKRLFCTVIIPAGKVLFLRTFWHATGLNWAEEEQVIARQIDLSLFIQKMSQDEKERIMISGLLSLVKVETFCLISLILRYGSEAKNQIRIREELLLKKHTHTCWGQQ